MDPENQTKSLEKRNQSAAIALDRLTRDQVELLKRTICRGATDDEMALFLTVAQRTGLDPFRKEIYAVKRKDRKLDREVMSIQTGIDGYRKMAERAETQSGQSRYAGQEGPLWCGPGGLWLDVWLDDDNPPSAAKVGIKRLNDDGSVETVWRVAKFSEYAQRGADGLTPMWRNMPANQLAKCAEALAFRAAVPNVFEGVMLDVEMEQADSAATVQKPRSLSGASAPAAASAEDVQQLKGIVTDVSKRAVREKKDTFLYIVTLKCGESEHKPTTFDRGLAEVAGSFKGTGESVLADVQKKGQFLNLLGLSAEQQPPEEKSNEGE